ncbi:MAG: CPBP family intramembrane metalloprotease [Caldithrix sp.]|nr:CPBP family intramembrane metalloprotease [Caldithrix sp.]
MLVKNSDLVTRYKNPWKFMAINFGWTWLCWIPAAVLSRCGWGNAATVLHFLGIGPLVAALFLIYRTNDRSLIKDYWKRVIDFNRISCLWYGVILLTMPLLTMLSAFIDTLLGGPGLQLDMASKMIEQPLLLIPFTVFILLFGPIPEELGWRGYALDALMNRFNALIASLIVGTFWSFWHLPLFFIEGTYHFNLGIGTFAFWKFLIYPVFGSVIITFIYMHTNRSTLAAVLFHFMGNYTGELFQLSGRGEMIELFAMILVSLGVINIWGYKTLYKATDSA